MATSEDLQQRIGVLAAGLADEFGELDEEDSVCWLDAIEQRAVAIGDALTRELTRQQSGERAPQDPSASCPKCGQQGRPKGLRERELIGLRGPVTLHEPEFYCPCCRKSFFPAGQRAGR